MLDLTSTVPTESQKLVAIYREKRAANGGDDGLIQDLVCEQEEKLQKLSKPKDNQHNEVEDLVKM